MKCKSCNYENLNGGRYCEYCGAPLEKTSGANSGISGNASPAQNTQSPPDNRAAANGNGDNWSMFRSDSSFELRYNESDGSPKYVGFGEAIKLYFRNYFYISGRSTRSEYWFAFLFVFLVRASITIAGAVLNKAGLSDAVSVIKGIDVAVCLGLLIPDFTLQVRRLHDIGKTGWWALGTIFIALFTIVLMILSGSTVRAVMSLLCLMYILLLIYCIIILVFMCCPSDKKNEWGCPAKPDIKK